MVTNEQNEYFVAELSYDNAQISVEIPAVLYQAFVKAWKHGVRFTYSDGTGLSGIDLEKCRMLKIR